jgi:hypothetical protein
MIKRNRSVGIKIYEEGKTMAKSVIKTAKPEKKKAVKKKAVEEKKVDGRTIRKIQSSAKPGRIKKSLIRKAVREVIAERTNQE